jgi:hypothetical protein
MQLMTTFVRDGKPTLQNLKLFLDKEIERAKAEAQSLRGSAAALAFAQHADSLSHVRQLLECP